MGLGSGMGCCVSRRAWMCDEMASCAASIASSMVSAAEKQPGRSGTTTP